eukprot:1390725-Amorphochlora_amoeboformis.AAC.2
MAPTSNRPFGGWSWAVCIVSVCSIYMGVVGDLSPLFLHSRDQNPESLITIVPISSVSTSANRPNATLPRSSGSNLAQPHQTVGKYDSIVPSERKVDIDVIDATEGDANDAGDRRLVGDTTVFYNVWVRESGHRLAKDIVKEQ